MQQLHRGAKASKFILTASLAWAACAGTASAIPVSGQGTWETTLQSRDINHDGVADAYYDTTLNITWLADSNVAATQGYRGEGGYPYRFGVSNESTFIASLDVYGVTGWRLPKVFDDSYAPSSCGSSIGPGRHCTFQADPARSEFASLFFNTLGNTVGSWSNTGNFLNVENNAAYYFGGFYTGPLDGQYSSVMSFNGGRQTISVESYSLYGWAVRDGDIALASPAPEPETYAMMLLGLAGIGAWAKRKKRQA